MARMYSRKRGKHGSKKPAKNSVSSWILYDAKKAELLVAKLGKDGKSASQIGMLLRDVYGIPSVKTLCNKSINVILREKNISQEVPDDLTALFRKYSLVKKHLDTNKKDGTAVRGLLITQSKINKLIKYYKKKGRIPEGWKFNEERAGFFAE